MISMKQLREDLKEVRYYYSRRQLFDEASKTIGAHEIVSKVQRYNTAMRTAPPRLYDLYVGLYVRNYTQEAYSIEMNYTPEYIQMQNKSLLLYLQTKI